MYLIALKMLFGDKIKLFSLIAGLTFSVLLITQLGSIFCGLMGRFSQQIISTEVPIWVMDRNTEMLDAPIPLTNDALMRVRNVDGVEWAMPLANSMTKLKLKSGKRQTVNIVGVDASTLIGIPPHVKEGDIKDLNLPDAIAIDKNNRKRFGNPKLGDIFEINDQRAKVVAIIDMPSNALSAPMVFTTYDKALNYIPPQRNLLSYVLVKPNSNLPQEEVIRRINERTGLAALSQGDFIWKTIMWYVKNTGIPINMGMTVALGVIFGVAITAQTFYTFVVENIKQLATLKALGVTNSVLTKMILLQSLCVGLIGYGLGIGWVAMVASTIFKKADKLAFYTPYQLLIIAFFLMIGVCLASSLLSIIKIRKIEPATVFRG
ncbi:MAG: ABC transporter permease [bacterium]